MRSLKLLLLTATLSLCASCAGHQVLSANPTAGCSTLLPDDWSNGVESADFPTQPELAADAEARATAWRQFGVRQTGQLDKSNDRYTGGVGIVRKCEERDAASVKHITRKWYEFWL